MYMRVVHVDGPWWALLRARCPSNANDPDYNAYTFSYTLDA